MEATFQVEDVSLRVENLMVKWKSLIEDYNIAAEEANKEISFQNKALKGEVESFLKKYSDEQLREIFLQEEYKNKMVESLFWDTCRSYKSVKLKKEVDITLPAGLLFANWPSYNNLREIPYTTQTIDVQGKLRTRQESFHIESLLLNEDPCLSYEDTYEHKYLLELKNKLLLLEEYNVETVTLSDEELKLIQELETLETLGEIL